MASQLTLFGDSTVNIKSTRRAFGSFLLAEYICYHVHVLGVAVLGCGQFLPFIIKRILGIKCIFPCSFGNKRMHLLTRVYGIFKVDIVVLIGESISFRRQMQVVELGVLQYLASGRPDRGFHNTCKNSFLHRDPKKFGSELKVEIWKQAAEHDIATTVNWCGYQILYVCHLDVQPSQLTPLIYFHQTSQVHVHLEHKHTHSTALTKMTIRHTKLNLLKLPKYPQR